MSPLRVPFGLQSNQLYEPRQVPNGKNCGCVCPACKRPLIARQNAATPHFAHSPGEDCAHALETAVHLAAKQIIAERQELRLPAVKYFNPYKGASHAKIIYVERTIKLDEVATEVWLNDMRPDIIATMGGQAYLVEIAATHFVDEAKMAKIRQRQIPTFEIDVAPLKNTFTFSALTDLLFTGTYPAAWLYHPRTEELAQEALLEYQTKLAAQETRRRQQQEEYIQQLERFRKYRELPSQQKLARNLRNLGLSPAQLQKLTTFVPWEKSFGAPRQVWQSAILAYLANEERGQEQWLAEELPCSIYPHNCLEWIREVFVVKPEVTNGDSIAFWKYIQHLTNMGILEKEYGGSYKLSILSAQWHEL